MEINKILQKIFKKIFQNLFKIFHGKIQLINSYDDLSIIKHKIDYLNIDKKNFDVKKNIYEINNAKIYTDLVENVAIIKDKVLIKEISFQQVDGELKDAQYNKVLSEGTPRFLKKINGTVVSLVQGVSGINYFHFLFDIIPRLKLISQTIDLEKVDYFYVQGNAKWQKNLLKSFNIPESKLIDCNKYRHIKANKIFAVEHPWYESGYFQFEIKNIPEWIIIFLRTKFINMDKKIECSKRIFIDRSDSKFEHCKLTNNDEIKNFLVKKGFASFEISKLDFFEQVHLFKNAEIIISPHGAALANIIFSNSNLRLIEIIPKLHPSRKCERISKILGFNYLRVELENKISKSDQIGDMEMSKNSLEKILNNEL
mgnify:CR=1 FL=1